MAPRPLIIDCDPGVDDAVALLLAFAASDRFDLRGVTTVAGNVNAERTAHNACIVRTISDREDVPVLAGAERPLQVAPVGASHFHGANGLGDLDLPNPKKGPERLGAVAFLIDMLRNTGPRPVDVAALGPLTNIALALRAEPACMQGIRQLVIMGGARREGGNITASAEFNIYTDPHAAAIVFSSGLPIVAIGLDATHQVRTTPERMQRLEALQSARARTACRLLHFGERVERELAQREGAPLHDPTIIAYLLAPELFETTPARIEVETNSALTRGHTSVEFRLTAPSHTRWVTGVDSDGVFDLLARRLA